jgi:hypothetical protein
VVVVCYVATAFRGRTKWMWILIFNRGNVVSKLVQMPGYTCVSLYILLDVSRILCFAVLGRGGGGGGVWGVVLCDAQYVAVNRYMLVPWFAVLSWIHFLCIY